MQVQHRGEQHRPDLPQQNVIRPPGDYCNEAGANSSAAARSAAHTCIMLLALAAVKALGEYRAAQYSADQRILPARSADGFVGAIGSVQKEEAAATQRRSPDLHHEVPFSRVRATGKVDTRWTGWPK
jgi:hypothetical protein